MKKILFVCTGNTCRSIMAEGIFNSAVNKGGDCKNEFMAFSAGISAYDGECANSKAIKVLKDWGIDITYHSSKRITKEDIEDAFIILTMTREHKGALISIFPRAENKIYTLKEYVCSDNIDRDMEQYNFGLDISDPYGMNEEVYRRCAQEIKGAVDKLLDKLKE